jgi:hypothetical protein
MTTPADIPVDELFRQARDAWQGDWESFTAAIDAEAHEYAGWRGGWVDLDESEQRDVLAQMLERARQSATEQTTA